MAEIATPLVRKDRRVRLSATFLQPGPENCRRPFTGAVQASERSYTPYPSISSESPYDPAHSGAGAADLRERTLLPEGEALFEPTIAAEEALGLLNQDAQERNELRLHFRYGCI